MSNKELWQNELGKIKGSKHEKKIDEKKRGLDLLNGWRVEYC